MTDEERTDGAGTAGGGPVGTESTPADESTPAERSAGPAERAEFEATQGAFDRPAATAGLVVAGVALAASFLAWTDSPGLVPPVAGIGSVPAAVFAAAATGAFGARRHDRLPRREGAAVAGVASGLVFLTAAGRFFAPAAGGGSDPVVGTGLPLAAVASLLGVGLALADAGDVPAGVIGEMLRRGVIGIVLIVGAFVVQALLAFGIIGALDALGIVVGPVGPVGEIALSVVLADTVFAAVALGFLVASGRGLGFVDLEWPDVRDLVYVGVGIVALFALLIALQLAVFAADLPSTSNNITESARQGNPETLLVLIPLSFLLIGPAEELLNRNVIQKYLYGPFSRYGAVVVASAIFAAAHVFSYAGDSVVGMVVSLTNVFLLSLVLGGIYERTDNIVVPTVVHGLFNAIQFGLLYVVIAYGDQLQQATALPW